MGRRSGFVSDGVRALPAADVCDDGPATLGDLLAQGEAGLAALRSAATPERFATEGVALAGLDLLSPVPRPGKIVAIGRNYADHAAEEGAIPPPSPLVFAKFTSSVIGPGAEIQWDPDLTAQVDYEAELAVVIGRRARRVEEAEALDYVLGYTCLNDISARDLQFADGQWVRAKSLDTFCPIGPAIVTRDEIPDPDDLAISCAVNGEILQDDRTSSMFYGVARLISHCSVSFTLEPGDVIATGTPAGVGIFRTPPRLLADGDVIVVSIERIGELTNPCSTRADRMETQP